ncbi:MAG: DEAD/DEAH box helicase, partial [Pseudonocardiaceae bacterium]
VEGHAVVLWSPETDPRGVAGLASTRTYPLVSSFKPSYNMAVNLVSSMGTTAARALLETSFAQFQADKSVVGLARKIRRNNDAAAGYAEAMHCDKGDFDEYFSLRRRITDREKSISRSSVTARRAQIADSLEGLQIGDVIRVPGGRRAGLAVILEAGTQPLREPRPLVLTEDRWAGRLSLADFTDRGTTQVTAIGRIKVPAHFNYRSPHERRDLASSLRNAARAGGFEASPRGKGPRTGSAAADDGELAELRTKLRRHPCHSCPDVNEHASWAQRREQLGNDTAALQRRVEHRTSSIARTFDQVCTILRARGYLDPGVTDSMDNAVVTPAGDVLARIWSESDLLVAECLRLGVWDDVNPAELAAAVSALLYESRRADSEPVPIGRGPLATALARTGALWVELEEQESEQGLSLTKQPDIGFVRPMLRWAKGETLERTLAANSEGSWRAEMSGNDLSAGDFVRWSRQVLDLMDQVAAAATAGSRLRSTAVEALVAVRRGILAIPAAEDSDEPIAVEGVADPDEDEEDSAL